MKYEPSTEEKRMEAEKVRNHKRMRDYLEKRIPPDAGQPGGSGPEWWLYEDSDPEWIKKHGSDD